MLINGESLEIEPAPQLAHVGIALRLAIHALAEALRSHGKLHGVDFENLLKVAENSADEDSLREDTPVIGSLAEVFPQT
jgi:hypothetical protein